MTINNEVVVQKSPKAREVAQSQQAQHQAPEQGGPSILEEFDNEIPQTTTETLSHTIIKE